MAAKVRTFIEPISHQRTAVQPRMKSQMEFWTLHSRGTLNR